jgi:hypothetical protein
MPRSPAQLARQIERLRERRQLASARGLVGLDSEVVLDVGALGDPHWTVERVREILEDYGLRAGPEPSCLHYAERGGRIFWREPGHR